MKLFYHHVGIEGSAADFPKTVFTAQPISIVETNVPASMPLRNELLVSLYEAFPGGVFNCWGVPLGASRVINNLSVGDAVLLIETTSPSGAIPALCVVKYYANFQLHELSHALWGSAGYPYIFFFSTEELNLTWKNFIEHVNYKENYDPRGSFLSISDERLSCFGGAEGYIRYLRENHSTKPPIIYSISSSNAVKELPADDQKCSAKVAHEMEQLVKDAINTTPHLTSGLGKVTKQSKSPPREEAFRRVVRRLYGAKCAVCSTGLKDRNGQHEVQSAHIFPKELDGTDDVRNGICLCRMHHWAFDSGWMSLSDDLTILVYKDTPETAEYGFIRRYEGQKIAQPIRQELVPHPIYLQAHRKLFGFE